MSSFAPPKISFMRMVSAYVMPLPGCSGEEQLAAAQKFFIGHLTEGGCTWGKVFADAPDARFVLCGERPGGRQCLAGLSEGEHLILAKTAAAVTSSLRWFELVRNWVRAGVVVHLLDQGLDGSTAT